MPPTLRNATSHDIARAAGVSQSTVSRTLRNDPASRPRPPSACLGRPALRLLAQRVGAKPRDAPHAHGRRGRRGHHEPLLPQLVEALHEQLGRAGYRMILFNERTDVRGDSGLEVIVNGTGTDGAIFLSVTIDPEVRGAPDLRAVPSVLLNRDVSRRRRRPRDGRPRRRRGGGRQPPPRARPPARRADRRPGEHLDEPRPRGRPLTRARARRASPLDPALGVPASSPINRASRAARSSSTARTRRQRSSARTTSSPSAPSTRRDDCGSRARTRVDRGLRRHPDGELGRVRADHRPPAARRHGPRRRADPRRAHRAARRVGAARIVFPTHLVVRSTTAAPPD